MDKTLEFYNKNAELFSTDTISADIHNIQNEFISLLPQKADILDFGCGSGRDTKYFLSNGLNVSAIDGSVELCKKASDYTGIEVKNMLFQDLFDIDEYDGIWACSSILHLAKSDLMHVFIKMSMALHDGGIIYTSFKYGSFEGYRGDRYYTDFDEKSFKEFLDNYKDLSLIRMWVSNDVRPERSNEKWLNILLKKTAVG